MAAHRAPSIPADSSKAIRILCLAFWSAGWFAWVILRGLREMPTYEDLATYPGGITLILTALRVWESGAAAIVSPQTRETSV